MIQKKICMLGASGVGKTSLVARFVHSLFSEKYLTTVGVKIDKKVVAMAGKEVTLVIWDLAGDDDFQRLEMSYLRGASGFLFVADGTRSVTLDQVREIQQRVTASAGALPFILAVNKADLAVQWEVSDAQLASLADEGWQVVRTSASVGDSVEDAFSELARKLTPAT